MQEEDWIHEERFLYDKNASVFVHFFVDPHRAVTYGFQINKKKKKKNDKYTLKRMTDSYLIELVHSYG